MRFKFNLRCMELICIKEDKWQRRTEQTLQKKKKFRAKRNDQPKPRKNIVDRKECPKRSAK